MARRNSAKRLYALDAATKTASRERITEPRPVDEELHDAAQRLLDECQTYYDLMRKRGLAGGCIWLTGGDGQMVVFTRGEYRHQLLTNIEAEMDAKRIYAFGSADTPGSTPYKDDN